MGGQAQKNVDILTVVSKYFLLRLWAHPTNILTIKLRSLFRKKNKCNFFRWDVSVPPKNQNKIRVVISYFDVRTLPDDRVNSANSSLNFVVWRLQWQTGDQGEFCGHWDRVLCRKWTSKVSSHMRPYAQLYDIPWNMLKDLSLLSAMNWQSWKRGQATIPITSSW